MISRKTAAVRLPLILVAVGVFLYASVAANAETINSTVPQQLSVREALRLGLTNNPQLKQARVSYLAAQSGLMSATEFRTTSVFASATQAAVGGQAAQLAGTAGGQLNWERRQGDSLSATVIPVTTSDFASNLRLQYRRPLIRQRGETSATNVRVVNAEYTLATQDNQYFLSQQNLTESIIRAYFNAVRARELIEVSESDVEIAKETARMARRKMEEGLVARIEVSRAEIQLAQSQDALIERRRAYRDALDNLLLTMGMEVGQEMELVDAVTHQQVELDSWELIDEAYENRRDLVVMDISIERQRLEQRVSIDDLRPSLDVVGSYTQAGLGTFGTGGAVASQSFWSGGVEYSLPIGSVSRRERREVATRALDQLLVDREFLRQQIANEILAAVRSVEAVSASLEIFSVNLNIAQENLRLAQRMVEEGLVPNRDLLEAQVALTRTRTNLLSAQIDYYLALVHLDRLVGRNVAEDMIGPIVQFEPGGENQPG